MKKQILLLVAFSLVIFAGSFTAFGQAVHYSTSRPLSCTGDALHPIAGQEWTYAVVGSVPGTYHFWATKDPQFIKTAASVTTFNNATALATPTDLLTATANYNNPGATAEVKITWSSSILSNTVFQGTPDPTGATPSPTYVAVYFKATDGCSDNFKVWELDPINGFTIDILAIDPDAVTTAPDFAVVPETCLDMVESATYASGAMVYDYGDNYLYFEIVASNFSGSFVPTAVLTGFLGTQTATSYEYTTDLPSAWGPTSWAPFVSGTTSITTADTDTKDGVSVFLRILIDHNNFEGIAGQTLTLTADAQNAQGEWDVVNDTCVDPGAADLNDTSTTKFTARPSVTDPAMPAPNVIPGNQQN